MSSSFCSIEMSNVLQNSKFLQFVSKMSRGELIIDDNQVKSAPGDWASEFQQQYNAGPSWADEYVSNDLI